MKTFVYSPVHEYFLFLLDLKMIRTCQRLFKARDLKKCSVFQSRSLTDKPDDPDKPYVPPGDEYRYHIRPPDKSVY